MKISDGQKVKKVGIIGGAGFIGSHVAKKFLKEGYDVKVSVTDLKKSEKYQHLFDLENSDQLNISELKVENLADLKHFINDCEIVVHAGTPFQLDVQDPQSDLMDPTIHGTVNLLEALMHAPDIIKVVIVASIAAYNTNFPFPCGNKTALDKFDENEPKFTDPQSHPYALAKFSANEIVEQFIADNPNLPFEITSVSPVMVMGKSLSHREDSVSTGIQFLFKNKIASDDFLKMLYDHDVLLAIVDVADVAEAIFQASIRMGLNGKNYILSQGSFPVSDVTAMLNKQHPKNDKIEIYINKMATRDLGIQFIPVEDTLASYSD